MMSVGRKVEVEYIDNYREMYELLLELVSNASRMVDVTHIRPEPPKDFPLAREYFDKLVEIAKDNPTISIRRIVAIPNRDMFEWVKSLEEVSEKYQNFKVRVVDWRVNIPAYNNAIVDGTHALIVIPSTAPESTMAIYVTEPDIVQSLVRYYEALWHAGEPLKTWMEKNVERFLEGQKERVTKPL